MAMMKKPVGTLKKATTMVPNLFTVGNMLLGFFAIFAAMDNRWYAAPFAIFFAHVFDMLDGRIARWMGQTSQFGAEFDSFADWLSFGLAPGIMVFMLFLKDFGKLGFLLAFFYVFAAAVRLARFNLKVGSDDDSGTYFTGLPVPGAGGFLCVLILLYGISQNGTQGKTFTILYENAPYVKEVIPVIIFVLSLLMISKVPYSAFKKTRVVRPRSLPALIMIIFIIFMIYAYPHNTIFLLYMGYILWGLLNAGWRAYRVRKTAVIKDYGQS